MIFNYQKHQEDFQRGVYKKEGSDLKRFEELLLEKTNEIESKETEIQKLKELNSSQAFSMKNLNQTLQNYRDALNQTESQIRSFETDKLAMESTIRVLRQENENFESDKARLRDVLTISNQGKDRLLMELEMKDKLLEQLASQAVPLTPKILEETQNDKPEKVKKEQTKHDSPNRKPKVDTKQKDNNPQGTTSKASPKKKNLKKASNAKEIFHLKQGLEEETLYNEVLELSQKAIDLLKKYELMVNSFHKTKKNIKGNLKDYIKPDVRDFYMVFQEILQRYSSRMVFLKDWLAFDGILKTGGPQETEINETLMNCKTFLMDFMTKEDLELAMKSQKNRKNLVLEPKNKEISSVEDVVLNFEEKMEENVLKGENTVNYIKNILLAIEKRKDEILPKDSAIYESLIEFLDSLKKEIENEYSQEKIHEKFNEKIQGILVLIENGPGNGILIWLYIKRLHNLISKDNLQEIAKEREENVLSSIDSDWESS